MDGDFKRVVEKKERKMSWVKDFIEGGEVERWRWFGGGVKEEGRRGERRRGKESSAGHSGQLRLRC